jgi:hypothetical protein
LCKKNHDVGAKHSGEQFCSSTEIFLSECFALSDRGGVDKFLTQKDEVSIILRKALSLKANAGVAIKREIEKILVILEL